MVVSTEGRDYRQRVKEILVPAFEHIDAYDASLKLWIEVTFPDRRRRDLDNLNKCLIDSVVKSGVIEDDHLIHDLRLVRVGVEKPGFVRLHLSEITS